MALVQIDVRSVDGKEHNVEVFFEATGQLAVDNDAQNVSWSRRDRDESESGHSMKIFHANGVPLTETGPPPQVNGGRRQPTQHLDWGAIHLTALNASNSWMGSSNVARAFFASSGQLPTADEIIMPLPALLPTQGRMFAVAVQVDVVSRTIGHRCQPTGCCPKWDHW